MSPASILIENGVPWSDGRRLDGDAVLATDGVIVAIGDRHELRDRASGPVVEVDAAGGLIAPSFADAHLHAAIGGVERLRCDLTRAEDAHACLRTISAYADRHEGEWVLGGGWTMSHFPGGTPSRRLLDEIVPDRPAYLINADHHGGWANSRALALAGITADTPDPEDGRIEREPDGSPAGTLHEGAMELLGAAVPEPGDEEMRVGLSRVEPLLLGAGITRWQEPIVGRYGGYPDCSAAYAAAIQRHELRGRPSGALWVPRELTEAGIPAFLRAAAERRRENAAAGFPCRTLKLMIDGVVENRLAAMHEPYEGVDAGSGVSYFSPGFVRRLIEQADAAGFSVHVHAIGDRAVSEALAGLAEIPPGRRGLRRHHIAHLQVVRAQDVPRFAELGVAVNAQALWACNEAQMRELTLPVLGEARSRRQYPFASLVDAGAELAMGSDWPVSTFDPWQAIHVAVTRRPPGERDADPLVSSEAIPLETALAAYTRGSHRLIGDDPLAGSLRAGAVADLAVADRNPFEAPLDEVHLTRNIATVLDGRLV